MHVGKRRELLEQQARHQCQRTIIEGALRTLDVRVVVDGEDPPSIAVLTESASLQHEHGSFTTKVCHDRLAAACSCPRLFARLFRREGLQQLFDGWVGIVHVVGVRVGDAADQRVDRVTVLLVDVVRRLRLLLSRQGHGRETAGQEVVAVPVDEHLATGEERHDIRAGLDDPDHLR